MGQYDQAIDAAIGGYQLVQCPYYRSRLSVAGAADWVCTELIIYAPWIADAGRMEL